MVLTDKEIKEYITDSIKYDILTNWILERLENNQKIDKKEIERLMSSLDFEIRHKISNLSEVK